MDVIASRIDTNSESFRRNRREMQALLTEVEGQLALARAGGGERSVARHRERGKLLIRERIELLLDRDAPFLELSPLAGWGPISRPAADSSPDSASCPTSNA